MNAEPEDVTSKIMRGMRDDVTAAMIEMRGMREFMTDGLHGVEAHMDSVAKGVAGMINDLRDEIRGVNKHFDSMISQTGTITEIDKRVSQLEIIARESGADVPSDRLIPHPAQRSQHTSSPYRFLPAIFVQRHHSRCGFLTRGASRYPNSTGSRRP
ncbi:MAG: hypothetical protein FWD68_20770 [Alphaproteobacteria bacterium]|nr:hypothetical protein [Alphaproteobacteria bacterium]